MLEGVHTGKYSIYDIISYGIVNAALKWDVTGIEAGKQLIYDYLRNRDNLQAKTVNQIEESEILEDGDELMPFIVNDDYNSLGDEIVIEYIDKIYLEIPSIEDIAIQNCKLSRIDSFFGISGPSSIDRLNKYDKINIEIDKHEQKYKTDAYVSIEKSLLFDLAKNPPDPAIFSIYCVIRSFEKRGQYT